MTDHEVVSLESTGERMIPESSDATTYWEHVYRYRFAAKFVRGKQVVDVACGEGYGAHAMELAGASSVQGFDISEEACRHATAKYGLNAKCADAADLPLADSVVDMVVSFETIEHLDDPAAFVRECHRILSADGLFIVSTPNRLIYSERGQHNRFHTWEMTLAEFRASLLPYFQRVAVYGQVVKDARWWDSASLAAVQSPWLKAKGFWRLRKNLLPDALGDGFTPEMVAESQRARTPNTILQTDFPLASVFNPFAVRRASEYALNRAKYLIAVCKGPRDCPEPTL